MKPFNVFPYDANFDFMRLRWISLGLALLIMLVGIGSMIVNSFPGGKFDGSKTFNYALDFSGGALVELRFAKPVEVDAVREKLAAAGFDNAQVQNLGAGNDVSIRQKAEHTENGEAVGKLTEENMADALKEVRAALLAADVHFKVAREFIERVQTQCVGQEVLKSVTPGQQIIKIIHDELVKLLGEGTTELSAVRPLRILMVGLHGSGKTTSTAKLGKLLKKKGSRPFVVACDVYRPAAIDQLEILAKQEELGSSRQHGGSPQRGSWVWPVPSVTVQSGAAGSGNGARRQLVPRDDTRRWPIASTAGW